MEKENKDGLIEEMFNQVVEQSSKRNIRKGSLQRICNDILREDFFEELCSVQPIESSAGEIFTLSRGITSCPDSDNS